MVHVDQYPALGVRTVEGVIDVSATRLALFLLIGGLAADKSDGVVFARAQIDHVCREKAREEEMKERRVKGEILEKFMQFNTF